MRVTVLPKSEPVVLGTVDHQSQRGRVVGGVRPFCEHSRFEESHPLVEVQPRLRKELAVGPTSA